MFKYILLFLSLSAIVIAQRRQRPYNNQQAQSYNSATTPVPILRQINTHNDDGSYTYGYEGADGSYKVETKAANGEVKGKYGYYDDVGQLREIEYGATKNGFVPSGTGINIPPPAPVSNNNINYAAGGVDYDDDGVYRPEIHERPYDFQPENRNNLIQAPPTGRAVGGGRAQRRYQQQQQQIQRPIYQQSNNNYYQQQQQQQQQYYEPQQQYYEPQQQQQQPVFTRSFSTNSLAQQQIKLHPAVPNFDLNTGSYSINY